MYGVRAETLFFATLFSSPSRLLFLLTPSVLFIATHFLLDNLVENFRIHASELA